MGFEGVSKGRQKSQKASALVSRLNELVPFREMGLIVTLGFSLFLALSLVTYHYTDPGWFYTSSKTTVQNSAGAVGAILADVFLYGVGYLAFLLPFLLVYSIVFVYRKRHSEYMQSPLGMAHLSIKIVGFWLSFSSLAALINMVLPAPTGHLPSSYSGGVLGALLARALVIHFNVFGSILILLSFFCIGVTVCTGKSWVEIVDSVGSRVMTLCRFREYDIELPQWCQACWRQAAKLSCVGRFFKSVFELPQLLLSRLSQFRQREVVDDIVEPNEPVFKSPELSRVDEVVEVVQQKPKKIRTPRYSRSKAIPKLSLLDSYEKETSTSASKSKARSQEVEQCISDFGIKVKVVAVHPGPVVTRYELQLAPGTKASKITGLAKDLARSLSVVSVRVVEVIPGKSVVGIELPNEKRAMVCLQGVLSSSSYERSRSALSIALGKDIAGHPVVVDLAKMPHLLVAGTTGSGKSVALNAMLLSLLYKSTPEQLRLILIDPKMLELSVYDGVPHLLTPVVTDMKDAASALRWCVAEMERRYRLMASLGVRNVAGYNEKVKQAIKRGAPLLDPLVGDEDTELQTLPQIVVIADEFADMMVVVGKKVETLIARLAQKARAAGVHLILATQRPSVDVITGLIKANIPTRIAFQVSSKVDSRTILDQQGAEQLLGHGDMLYLPPGSGVPVRVHGAFVSDDEVHRVVDYLRSQSKPEYLSDILEETISADPSGFTSAAMGESEGEQDEYYDAAVAFIAKARRVSVSSVQRRFKIGYNRAARIVETMETAGVVTKPERNGVREVLVPPPPE